MRPYRIFLVILAAIIFKLTPAGFVYAQAQQSKQLVIDTSDPIVAVTTHFTGSDFILFGSAPADGDIIIVVRGPIQNQIIRKKEKIAGIWLNKDSMEFEAIPSFYMIAANRPLEEIITPLERTTHQIGLEHLVLEPIPGDWPEQSVIRTFRKALIQENISRNLYYNTLENVIFKGDHLFRADIRFPSNIPTGTYGIDVYFMEEGLVVKTKTKLLTVRKFGFGAWIYDFAHRHALVYGVFAVFIAIIAGWIASLVFKRS